MLFQYAKFRSWLLNLADDYWLSNDKKQSVIAPSNALYAAERYTRLLKDALFHSRGREYDAFI